MDAAIAHILAELGATQYLVKTAITRTDWWTR